MSARGTLLSPRRCCSVPSTSTRLSASTPTRAARPPAGEPRRRDARERPPAPLAACADQCEGYSSAAEALTAAAAAGVDAAAPGAGDGGLRQQHDPGDRQQHHQQVVVRPADGVEHDQRVEPDEQGWADRVAPHPPDASPHQGDDPQRAECGQRLQRPQSGLHPEGHRRVGHEGPQRPVRTGDAVLGREAERQVARDPHRRIGVRVEPVNRSQARVLDVGEDVARQERRRQQEHDVYGHDAGDRPTGAHRTRARQHDQVAHGHAQQEQRKALRRQPVEAERAKRPPQPIREAMPRRRDLARPSGRRPTGDQHGAREQQQHPAPGAKSPNPHSGGGP